MNAIDRTVHWVANPEEFDWNDVTDCIVQRAVEQVAIYDNPAGDVVVRQAGAWNEDREPFIVIARANAVTAAHAILAAAGMSEIEFIRPCGGGYEDVPIQPAVVARMARRPTLAGLSDEREPEPYAERRKDRTAAARKRKQRQRERDDRDRQGVTPVTVTPSDRDSVTEGSHLRLIAAE